MTNNYVLKINDTTTQTETYYVFPFEHLRDAAFDIIDSVLHETNQEALYIVQNYQTNGTFPFLTNNDVNRILAKDWEPLTVNLPKATTMQKLAQLIPQGCSPNIDTITIP